MIPIMRDCDYLGKSVQGNYEQQSRTSKMGDGNQKWVDRGIAKILRRDEDGEYIWWPDTGDVLSVYYAQPYWSDKQRNVKFAGRKRRHKWRTYPSRKLGEASLPEMLFRDPIDYFSRFDRGRVSPVDVDLGELTEMRQKTSSIRIPTSAPRESYVIHHLTHDYVYEGFRIENRPVEEIRQSGYAVVDHRINIGWYDTGCIIEEGDEMPIVSLLRVIDNGAPVIWDRKRCEAFFDDDAHFM